MSDPLPTSDQILTSQAQDFRNLKITHKPTKTMCHWQHLLRQFSEAKYFESVGCSSLSLAPYQS